MGPKRHMKYSSVRSAISDTLCVYLLSLPQLYQIPDFPNDFLFYQGKDVCMLISILVGINLLRICIFEI